MEKEKQTERLLQTMERMFEVLEEKPMSTDRRIEGTLKVAKGAYLLYQNLEKEIKKLKKKIEKIEKAKA